MKHTAGARLVGRKSKQLLLLVLVIASAGVAFGLSSQRSDRTAAAEWVLQSSTPAKAADTKPRVVTEPNRSLPARLIVPRLKIDAPVVYMGLTAGGAMDAPDNVAEAGWYKNGPLPGNKGSAVIAGHVNGTSGQPGVFADLRKLMAGDMITVTDTNGLATSFVVRMSKTYGQTEQPAEVFNSPDGAHLNLISCIGAWNSADRQYAQRLVVFADKR